MAKSRKPRQKKARSTIRKPAKSTRTKSTAKKAGAPRTAAPGGHTPAGSAEIIVRQGFMIDATGKGPHAIPEVLMLANAEGCEYLAAVFADLARRARSREAGTESVHLPRNEHPINIRLSDDIDFRFAPLSAGNRRAMFKQFGIDTASRQKGSLFERYQEVVAHFGRLQNLMRREGLVE
ncbi:MAG: hypothetical protein HZB38_01450 [Planctomycetes bacterium]|nr:hypothetical protein [Planctomycetota bacterium]